MLGQALDVDRPARIKRPAEDDNMTHVEEVYHFGGREQVVSEKRTIRLVYHDFANLPEYNGFIAPSSTVWCHGYEWQPELNPSGYKDVGYFTSFHLRCLSANPGQKVKAGIEFRVNSADFISLPVNVTAFTSPKTRIGWDRFVRRAEILDPTKRFLPDGNLTLDVTFQVYDDKQALTKRRKPTPLVNTKNLLNHAANFSGTTFLVGTESFPAHLQILQTRAPGLAALVEEFPPNTSIPLLGDTIPTFRALLNYVHFDELPAADEFQSNAIQLLNAADRFVCQGLKFEAEAEIIASGLNVETAADLVLLGDAKNCALLKEAAIDFIVANSVSVMKSAGWLNISKSAELLAEIIRAFSTRNIARSADDSDYDLMRVSTLQENLEKMGLDIDGSREILVGRLKEAENNN